MLFHPDAEWLVLDSFHVMYPVYYKDLLEAWDLTSRTQKDFCTKLEELVLGPWPGIKNACPCAILSCAARVLAAVLLQCNCWHWSSAEP